MEKDEVMREAFEETIEPDQLDRHLPVDEYKNLNVQMMWEGYQSGYKAALSAIPTTSGDGWIDVNNETKLAEGFMRLYSFKPVINEKRPDCNLRRAYDFSRILGSRERDMYLDIPIPQPKEGNNEH